jgi:site-specific DNA-methyltransferase (adenine-specific)
VQPSVVCDPFCGSGTAGIVALRLGRKFIGIDLSEEYCRMARNRIVGPLFAEETA